MTKPKTYDPDMYDCIMQHRPDGERVELEDYEKLLAKHGRLVQLIRNIAKQRSAFDNWLASPAAVDSAIDAAIAVVGKGEE